MVALLATDGEDLQLDLQLATNDGSVPTEAEFRRWATAAIDAVAEQRKCLTLRIVDEAEIHQLNRDYRGKDQATNVLSFPFQPLPGIEVALLGDIIICAAVVALEAQEQGKMKCAHWAHMVVHGVFHLCGYDHVEEQQAQVMEQLEADVLAGLGYENPYLPVA